MKHTLIKRFLSAMVVLLLVFTLPSTAWAASSGHIKIVLDPQGGTGGDSEIYVVSEGSLPNIAPPTRRGYHFLGYYSAASGQGTQYYDATGKALKTCDFTGNAGLYAAWRVKTLVITYRNMEGASFGVSAPNLHTYSKNTEISNPSKPDYNFFGWRVNGSAIASRNLTLGANAYDGNIELMAVWNKATLVTQQNNTTETVVVQTEDLKQVFQRQVSDPETGVTADDLNSEEVCLTMTVSNADEQAEGAGDIIDLAQGEILKFYDFSVSKTVTKLNQQSITTALYELPNTVQVEITLSRELQGSPSYRVYRFHNGQAQAIPLGPVEDATQRKESFALSPDGTKLILRTRRLSTYAVVSGERALGGTGTVEHGNADLDVQAQVKEGGDSAVYKVDIVWGPMRFTYSTGREWDPDEHRYTDVQIYDWIPAECYTKGNNEIIVYNHSNADVQIGFTVFPKVTAGADTSLMDGVDMVVSSENRADAPPATDVFLSKVPAEGAAAPTIRGYLRLNGSPDDPEFYKGLDTDPEGYVQVADIAVTIAHLDGPRT